MEHPSTPWFVVATFVLLSSLFLPPSALAYSPWEWRYGETIYSTQAQALAAMHAQSDEHALLTKLLGVQTFAQSEGDGWITYEYGAPHPAGVIVPMNPNIGGGEPSTDWWWDASDAALPRFYTSEFDAAMAYGNSHFASDSQCAPLSVQMSGPLETDVWIGGVSYEEGPRVWSYTYELYNPSTQHCEARHGDNLPPGVNGAFRFRWVDCPPPYIIDPESVGPNFPCILPLTDFIEKRAVTDDSCEATPHPVDISTGDKFLIEQDYEAAGLRFVRTYHAMELGHDVGLGAGWTHNYAARLLFNVWGSINGVVLDSGKTSRMQFDGNGIWRGLSDAGYQLSVRNACTDMNACYVLDKPDGSKLVFSGFGKLTGSTW